MNRQRLEKLKQRIVWDCPEFRVLTFKVREGQQQALMECNPHGMLWMLPVHVDANIDLFGPHRQLLYAKEQFALLAEAAKETD